MVFRSVNILTYHAVIVLQTRIPTALGRCWKRAPVTLEDALGRLVPIPLELINSYKVEAAVPAPLILLMAKVLESILEVRVRQMPGYYKVKKREYTFRANSLDRDVQQSSAFDSCFLPRQHINMSMVFDNKLSSITTCPGCNHLSGGSSSSEIRWYASNTNIVSHI